LHTPGNILGNFQKLPLQLGWVGSQQNANLSKRVGKVRRSFYKCSYLQEIPIFSEIYT
jgi:hypothetical protein